jgi:hypothetical protein
VEVATAGTPVEAGAESPVCCSPNFGRWRAAAQRKARQKTAESRNQPRSTKNMPKEGSTVRTVRKVENTNEIPVKRLLKCLETRQSWTKLLA